MKHFQPDEFEQVEFIPDIRQFLENASLNLHRNNVEFEGEKALVHQQISKNATFTEGVALPLYVSPSEKSNRPKRTRRGPGRPKKTKRGRPAARKTDGRTRTMEGPITAAQRRDLLDAKAFAAKLERPLNLAIDIHPNKLENHPGEDIGLWFRNGPLRALATFFGRQKDTAGRPVGWHAVGIRENYISDGIREHLHIVCHCRECDRAKAEEMLRRRFPGDGAIHVGDDDLDNDGFEYRLKQSAGNAMGKPRPGRPTAQKCSRHDGAPVGPVFGKRIFISRSIDAKARTHGGWQQDQDELRAERRDYYRAKEREAVDRESRGSNIL